MNTVRLEKIRGMLENDPADQMLRYMFALELEKAGENTESLEYLQQLMDDEKPHVPAFLMAGQQLARLNQPDQARKVYQAGVSEARRQGNDHAAGEMTQFLSDLG